MHFLNFSFVNLIVRPKQPFLDWLYRVDDPEKELTMEDIAHDTSTFLLPDYDTNTVRDHLLKSHFKRVFIIWLKRWYNSPVDFPKPITLNGDFFIHDFKWGSIVVDLGEGYIEGEDFDQ